MSTLTIKNVPADLYERLKESASANRRSIDSEVIVCLECALYSQKIDPTELLARARVLREKSAGYVMSDDELADAKRERRL